MKQTLSPMPSMSGTVGLVQGLKIYISHIIPSDDDGGGVVHTWNTSTWSICINKIRTVQWEVISKHSVGKKWALHSKTHIA